MAVLLFAGARSGFAQSRGLGLGLPLASGPAPSRDLTLGFDSLRNPFSTPDREAAPDGFRLDLSGPFRALFRDWPALPSLFGPAWKPERGPGVRTLWVTAGALTVVPVVGALSWWRHDRTAFHVNSEGWFGRDTYAGGADKASHFWASYTGTRLLTDVYRSLGNSPRQSRLIALGVVILSGALVEVGDGTAYYGFSWPDLAADAAGAFAGLGVEAAGIGDAVGIRYGYVGARRPASAEDDERIDTDYSREIYTLDVKLAGVFRRMKTNPGPARFLLLSATYGSKGYRYSSSERRERNVGVEVGLNVPEILRAAGVSERSWWGNVLLTVLEHARVPFTAIGVRYDLNHGRWHGPDAGNAYDPGP